MAQLKEGTDSSGGPTREQLEDRLNQVNAKLLRELRARGFDPAQDDNLALTAPLAKLYTERENLRAELEALNEDSGPDGRDKRDAPMTETERILDQLHRAFEGDAWHGPSVVSILDGVTAQQAATHPIANAHSIWEIVLHIGAWEAVGTRRLGGDPAKLSDEEDWPSVGELSEAAWQQTKEKLKSGHDQFRDAIAELDDSKLDGPVVESAATVYGTLHGIIQHTLYHAGQIAMLKKATEGAKR